jgi:hypothetical protein
VAQIRGSSKLGSTRGRGQHIIHHGAPRQLLRQHERPSSYSFSGRVESSTTTIRRTRPHIHCARLATCQLSTLTVLDNATLSTAATLSTSSYLSAFLAAGVSARVLQQPVSILPPALLAMARRGMLSCVFEYSLLTLSQRTNREGDTICRAYGYWQSYARLLCSASCTRPANIPVCWAAVLTFFTWRQHTRFTPTKAIYVQGACRYP